MRALTHPYTRLQMYVHTRGGLVAVFALSDCFHTGVSSLRFLTAGVITGRIS